MPSVSLGHTTRSSSLDRTEAPSLLEYLVDTSMWRDLLKPGCCAIQDMIHSAQRSAHTLRAFCENKTHGSSCRPSRRRR
jgi:NADH:ubiquinone oxidoreductase subunit B-like Fe-S oxidoreductase